MSTVSTTTPGLAWRTPAGVVVCGCVIAMLAFGPRSSLGQFLTPLSMPRLGPRRVLLALRSRTCSGARPAVRRRHRRPYGTVRFCASARILYALGLALMAYSSSPAMLHLSAGVLIGFGLSGCSFTMVIGAFGKLVPENWRAFAFGAGTAAGRSANSCSRRSRARLIDAFGWQSALLIFAALMLLVLPLSLVLATPRASRQRRRRPRAAILKQALSEAFAHRSYVLLVIGFFTCGFQLAFVTVQCRPIWSTAGCRPVGAWTIGVIGLFNIVGSLASGWLAQPHAEAIHPLGHLFRARARDRRVHLLPVTPVIALLFGAVTGFLWLSTVPPTIGLVAVMFGTRWLAMLFGFAFFSHQVGGFLGVWLGGIVFERTGSYDIVWWLSVFFGVPRR